VSALSTQDPGIKNCIPDPTKSTTTFLFLDETRSAPVGGSRHPWRYLRINHNLISTLQTNFAAQTCREALAWAEHRILLLHYCTQLLCVNGIGIERTRSVGGRARGGEPGRRSTRRPGTARAPAARPPPAPARCRRRSPWRRPRKRRELSGGPVVERGRIVPSDAGDTGGIGKGSGPDPNAAWRSSESGRRTRGDGAAEKKRCGVGFWCGVGARDGKAVWLVRCGARAGSLVQSCSCLALFIFKFFLQNISSSTFVYI